MRRFSLINSKGNTYNLTDNVSNVLLNEVEGLGFEREESYRVVGNRYVLVSRVTKLINISGKLNFYGDHPYKQYQEFMNFSASEPLYMKYKPIEGDIEYTIIVNMSKIEKGELDKDTGELICPVEFTKLSPFYRESSVVTQGYGTTQSKYAFKFSGGINGGSIVWDQGKTNKFRSAENMNVIIDSDAYEDSPCKLIIDGPVVNPHWDHYVDGVLVTEGRVNCTVPNGYKLVVDSISDITSITIFDSSLSSVYMDVYQLSDFTTDRFLYLQHGKNSIQVSSESADIVTVKLETRLSYVSV